MRYFYKKVKGNQTYVYMAETGKDCRKIHKYIGNLNNLPEEFADEVHEYFAERERKQQFKEDGNYGLLSRRTMKIDNMKFGDMWLIYEIEKKIRLVEIIDNRIVKRERRETLSMGYYFLFAIINRMIHPVSKNKISDWLRKYDLRTIFGIEIDHHKFTSDAYWQGWNRVKLEDIEYISNELFIRCCKLSGIEFKSSACSYDTSNFFLFMSSTTDSELAERGKNKQGRDNLRQIGLSILVDNYTGLILHYKIYKGNMHDSKVFYTVINDMIAQAKRCGKEDFTIVFDKGMNSDENIAELDKINKEYKCTFVTSYSTSDEHNLMRIPLNNYHIINCKHNTQIDQEKNRHPENAEKLENSKVRAFSLHRSFWGKERNVVLLYSPETAKKQKYLFDKNLEKLRNWIIEAQKKIKANSPYYRNESSVVNLYRKEAIKYHISPDVFELSFSYDGCLKLNFKKRDPFISDHIRLFGKSILICNDLNLSTEKIVQLFFDKNVVENTFRQCKDDECCSVWPIYHWTDSKIQCHFFCSIAAYSFLKLIELTIRNNGIQMTGKSVLEKMGEVESDKATLILPSLRKEEYLVLSNINKLHKKVFSIFNYEYIENQFRVKS